MISGDATSWEDLFERDLLPSVLDHVVNTWNNMPKPGPSDEETQISLALYSKLTSGKDRNAHAFLIRYEDVEIDTDLAIVTGRKDIVFYPWNDEDIYLCLEAKRLNAFISGRVQSLADRYVKEGMQRFVDGQYARHVRHGAMLGYVLDGDIDRAMQNVDNNVNARLSELRMDQGGGLADSSVRPGDPQTKETQHHREHENTVFRIHHLFVA